MRVDAIPRLQEDLRARVAEDPAVLTAVARIMPAARCFDFQAYDDFESQARETMLTWVPNLASKAGSTHQNHKSLAGKTL